MISKFSPFFFSTMQSICRQNKYSLAYAVLSLILYLNNDSRKKIIDTENLPCTINCPE